MADNDRDGGGFLARWSERKLRARQGADEAVGEDLEQAPPEDSGDPAPAAEESAPPPTDADMPPLETLGSHSDYSGFLSPGVSEDLRRAALTKLFHSPHLNITDGLDDYDEDFTSFAPLGDVMTADLRHRMEVAAKRLLDKQAAAEEEEAGAGTEILADAPEDSVPEQSAPEGSATAAAAPLPGIQSETEEDLECLPCDLQANDPISERDTPETRKP